MFNTTDVQKSSRIPRLVKNLYAHMPVIESARAKLVTESYQATEGEPIITRRAKAFAHILRHIPIIIRDEELVVGSSTIAPRGCQTFPEYSFQWLEDELDTVETRTADPFYIAEETKQELREVHKYWKGKTTSELATSYMAPEAIKAIEHNIFTPGNYFYNGVGHVTVKYEEVLAIGYEGIIAKAQAELDKCQVGDGDYARKSHFLNAVILSCQAVIEYAERYAALAQEMAAQCQDPQRRSELLMIAQNCSNVPRKGATTFYEACQSFWFVQQLLQMESSGHSISPGRFDQYMYPYYKADLDKGMLTREFAQELLDCIWVKLNDLNKCRDAASAEGFAGYSLFQNLIVGGQNKDGEDVTNDLSFMCIQASKHVFLPMPSLSIRVWNGSPHELLIKAAELTRTGIGLPAYYNDEVIIPALTNRGISLHDARGYGLIGCVEPSVPGKEQGWHDAAFVNVAKILEITIHNGKVGDLQIGPKTGEVDTFNTLEDFMEAFQKQIEYFVYYVAEADNCVDYAHMERGELPFLSSFVADCISDAKGICAGGAKYNFTGPQAFGVADSGDSVYAIKKHVFDNKDITFAELKEAMDANFGYPVDSDTAPCSASAETDIEKDLYDQICKILGKEGISFSKQSTAAAAPAVCSNNEKYERIRAMMDATECFGNDIDEVDMIARRCAQIYCYEVEKYRNPRGGQFQAGIYPVSANVLFGKDVGALPDGRLAKKPLADGCSPRAGKDVKGPTAAAASVAKLDHEVASNGTLYNQKFLPSAVAGDQGLMNFAAVIRSYFDKKGMHVQFNVVDKETLLDAQAHPENYKDLVVRVAGYSAMFTELAKEVQDDIISRTEQHF